MDVGSKKYFNMEIEPLLNTPQMKDIQLKKLKYAVKYFYENVPLTADAWKKQGLCPRTSVPSQDFARAVPIAGQADYRDVFKECDSDMGKSFEILFGQARLRDLHLLTTTSITHRYSNPLSGFP